MTLLANPLAQGIQEYRIADPCTIVIFGATGDLSARKLLPSLFNLARQRLFPPGTCVVGAALDDISEEEFKNRAADSIRQHSRTQPVDPGLLADFLSALHYQPVKFDESSGFESLKSKLDELDSRRQTGGNRIFYCAVPPQAFPLLVEQIGKTGLAEQGQAYRRIVFEKPFGTDLLTARELTATINRVFPEQSVFRIDHYLGKETVQNIAAFRFANVLFEPVWNNQYVDSLQITVAEELGVELRGGYYDHAGALRDIVQNHLLQVLALVTMEPPVSFDQGSVRDEKVKVLRSISPISGDAVAERTVRAQYSAGWVQGRKVPGYREEQFVSPDSTTETYVALKLGIDNWRWAGVPIFARTGKRMPKRITEVRIQFKRPPHLTFGMDSVREVEPNAIVLRIQPEEGISLGFAAKVPTAGIRLRSVNMDFLYTSSFLVDTPDAYERLILDCMVGDATLFTRADEVDAAWTLIDPIEEAWRSGSQPVVSYPSGSWGPTEAEQLLARDGGQWRRL
ncbi:MAG TPA: glucose-6-phosphate dehydrogenase [Candidatus Dormibacteraeota bacterium]|nr:glucose-6-phosphate dehydrogenase [Candidatus Dormibacteraeota bacterium]